MAVKLCKSQNKTDSYLHNKDSGRYKVGPKAFFVVLFPLLSLLCSSADCHGDDSQSVPSLHFCALLSFPSERFVRFHNLVLHSLQPVMHTISWPIPLAVSLAPSCSNLFLSIFLSILSLRNYRGADSHFSRRLAPIERSATSVMECFPQVIYNLTWDNENRKKWINHSSIDQGPHFTRFYFSSRI